MDLVKKIILVAAYLPLSLNWAISQYSPQPSFINFSTEHGLPSSEVYEVYEDKQGYLWFSTDNGVSKFDGYTFKNYSAEEGLKSNVVFHFFEDDEGRMWINTLTGEIFYYQNDRFYPYQFNEIIKKHQEKYWGVGKFVFDRENSLFLKMNTRGLLKIDSSGRDQIYGPDHFGVTIIEHSEQAISATFTREDGTFDPKQKDDYIEHKIGSIQFRNEEEVENITFPIASGKSYSKFKFLNITKGEYLLLWGNSILYIKDRVVKWNFGQNIPVFVPCLKRLKDGSYFLSHTDGKGIRRYNSLEDIRLDNYEVWLDEKIISDVFKDRNGGYWFTSIGEGIFYVPNINIMVYDERSGLTNQNISSIAVKDNESLFFVDQVGNFRLLNHKQYQIQELPSSNQKKPIISLFYDDKSSYLWSGATPLKFFDGNTWTTFSTEVHATVQNTLTNIKSSSDKTTLWGAGALGFASIQLGGNELEYLSFGLKDFATTRTFVVFEDSQNRVLVSNLKGFFELKNNELISLNEKYPSFNLRIEDIAEDEDNTIILGVKGAGVLFWEGDKIEAITEKKGLYSNMIEHLEMDDDGHLWVGSLNGLNLVEKDSLDPSLTKILGYSIAHGLPSNEINFLESQGDTLWIATPKGLVLFPKQQAENCQNNYVFLEKIIVNDQDVNNESFQFEYDENNIRLEYLSINIKLRGQIDYRYRLNSKSAWRYTKERAANFFDLPAGSYFFEVQAQDENRKWTPSLKVEFIIKPPFWETAWFITLAIIGIITLIWLAVNRYIARIRRDNEIEKEMQILKASALQAQMNPHFVFNCLNAIQSFIAGKESEKATRYLARFATLVRNNLNASVNKVVTLDEEIQTIENYLSFEKMRFQKKIDYKIEVDPNLQIYDIEIPPLMTLPYVENAVIHGLLKSPRPGQLEIKYFEDNLCLIIEIQDNGLGIFQTQKINPTQKLDGIHKSIGMSISKKMQELFNEGLEEEDLIIEELKNDEGEVEGTRIRLSVKMKKTSN